MRQGNQHWSAETHLQHCCSCDTTCVDPLPNNSETHGLDYRWNEAYGQPGYNTPSTTQPFTEYERPQKVM